VLRVDEAPPPAVLDGPLASEQLEQARSDFEQGIAAYNENDFARAAERVAGLASVLLGTQVPLAVGRAQRIATPAQRRALAVRDGGCVIPGCGVPAEACQVHHLNGWAAGGATDEANCVLLCWAHHRQVDLRMWTIEPVHPEHPIPHPGPGAPPGTPWPGNNRSPWVIRRRPRSRWRL